MVPMTFIWWIYHFWARFWPYFNFVDFRAYFGPFSLVNRDRQKMADLLRKMASNQKMQENKPTLKFNFTIEKRWPDSKFSFWHSHRALLFVHLLLMSVDLTSLSFGHFSHLCFLRFLTAGILCLLLWLLSDTFPITSAPYSSQEYDVLSWILVWWMRRRTSSVELLPHSVQRYVVISLSILATNWWKV